MQKLASPFEIGNHLENLGWDIHPIKTDQGKYIASVYKHSQFIRNGKLAYNDWQECIRETQKIIYDKITNND